MSRTFINFEMFVKEKAMQVLLLTLILLAIAIAGIAIKMFFVRGATFTKTCGSKFDPDTGKPMACTCHGKLEEDCDNLEKK